MTRVDVILAILLVIGVLIFVFVFPILQPRRAQTLQPSKPRISLPSDKNIYTVTLSSKLKDEEWSMILGAGWSFITCTTEQCKEYVGCYPEAPSYNKTYYHYVFKKD